MSWKRTRYYGGHTPMPRRACRGRWSSVASVRATYYSSCRVRARGSLVFKCQTAINAARKSVKRFRDHFKTRLWAKSTLQNERFSEPTEGFETSCRVVNTLSRSGVARSTRGKQARPLTEQASRVRRTFSRNRLTCRGCQAARCRWASPQQGPEFESISVST